MCTQHKPVLSLHCLSVQGPLLFGQSLKKGMASHEGHLCTSHSSGSGPLKAPTLLTSLVLCRASQDISRSCDSLGVGFRCLDVGKYISFSSPQILFHIPQQHVLGGAEAVPGTYTECLNHSLGVHTAIIRASCFHRRHASLPTPSAAPRKRMKKGKKPPY